MAITVFKNILPVLLVIGISTSPACAQKGSKSADQSRYYLQCAAHMGNAFNDPGYKSKQETIGIFQFDLHKAQQAGLCSNAVPITRHEQVWRLCDFKGPIAEKYNIHNQFEFRFDKNAAAAQFEMMKNMTPIYDAYIYQRGYDRYFNQNYNGVMIDINILRGLIHTKGKAAVDDFMNRNVIFDSKYQSLYSMATCLQQCLISNGKMWLCQ